MPVSTHARALTQERDHANSMAAIKDVLKATNAQIGLCEAEMAALDAQAAECDKAAAAKQGAISVATERLGMRNHAAPPTTLHSSYVLYSPS